MADEPTVAPSAPSAPEPSAPASTPEPSSAPSSAPEGVEFAGLGTDFDDAVEIDLTAQSDAGEAEAPEPEAPVVAKAAPAAPKPPEAPKAPEPKAPAAEGPKETAQAAPSPPSEPRSLVEQLGQHRVEILDELAKTRFAWDKGEEKAFMDALDVDASKALVEFAPRMMSRMYYESVTAALNHINQFVPVLLANYTKAMESQKAAETQFFGQFPAIQKDKHWNDVLQFANIFKQQNPQLPQADLLAMVGAAVMAKNKLVAQGVNGGAPPRRTATPAFVPARAGGSSVSVKTEPESPYAGLGADHEE